MTRVAPAAQSILTQATQLRPRRSKASDGTVGDRAHRNRVSDHNPDRRGIVHAADLTHDPKNGMDAHAWAQWLAAKKDRRVKYIISNRRIWEPAYGWSRYGGSNPHDKHVHVSVTAQHENDTSPWFAGFLTPPQYAPPTTPVPPVVPTVAVPTVAVPPTPPTPQEPDVRIYKLIYPNRTEHWLVYADGWRTNLTGANDVADLQQAFPTVSVVGEQACSTFKNFTTERAYSAIATRPPT